MTYRLAFASSDGKNVNEHFGRAKDFVIIEINNKESKYIETRINKNPLNKCGHDEGYIDELINVISDCRGVFVAKMGKKAASKLRLSNIQGFEMPYGINEIIEKVVSGKYKFFDFE